MNSKYLIIQIDIEQGTQWGDKRAINPIRDIFIPSVQTYCENFNYDYLLVKESIYEKKIWKF
mgnify:FL=1